MERTYANLTEAATIRIEIFWNKEETIEQNTRRINSLVNQESRRWDEMEAAGEVTLSEYQAKTEVLWYMQRILQRMAEAGRAKEAA